MTFGRCTFKLRIRLCYAKVPVNCGFMGTSTHRGLRLPCTWPSPTCEERDHARGRSLNSKPFSRTGSAIISHAKSRGFSHARRETPRADSGVELRTPPQSEEGFIKKDKSKFIVLILRLFLLYIIIFVLWPKSNFC